MLRRFPTLVLSGSKLAYQSLAETIFLTTISSLLFLKVVKTFVNEFNLTSLEETERFGELLAGLMTGGILITLSGNLGAGKTTLVKSIGKGLGVEEVISSPTFTTMNEYHSGELPLYHIDLYRVSENIDKSKIAGMQFFALEFEEILEDDSVVVVEWPEYFLVEGEYYLKDFDRLEIRLDPDESDPEHSRVIKLKAHGEYADKLVNKILDEPGIRQ